MKPAAPSRDPRFWCGEPGFRGCKHWAPFVPPDVTKPRDGAGETRHRVEAKRHYEQRRGVYGR